MGEPRRLAIVGVGLIGGSVGLAAKRAGGWRVVGTDPAGPAAAMAAEAVDEWASSPAGAAAGAALVVVAVPVGVAAGVLPGVAGGRVVTDVGSTKRSIVAAAADLGLPQFVGSHPMAGGERGGVAHARADLFDGAVCLVTPTPGTEPTALETVSAFWRALGGRVVTVDPVNHDRLVADVSHGPHAVAAAVARSADHAAVPLAASGWRDVTRVAGGDPDLWRDILLDNRDHVRATLGRVRDDLCRLIAHLDAADATAVRQWLDEAADARRGSGGGRGSSSF